MKIAIVHNLPAGGQKRALYEQCKRLSARHTLDLFTFSSADETFLPLTPFVKKHEVINYRFPAYFPQSVWSIYTDLPKAYKKMADMINSGGYDVVFVSPCFLTQAPYILRYLKIPTIYHCAEPKREFYEKIPRISNSLTYRLTLPFRIPIKAIDKKNTKAATKVVSISKFAKKNIDSIYGINSSMNYLGVDTHFFKPIEVKKENFVLSVGDLSLHKGHDFIIKSLALLYYTIRPKLIIAALGGTEKNYLIKLSRQLGVQLEFREQVTDEELVTLYNQAKLLLFAPLSEPFGLVILEAGACGTYTVAVSEGATGEIVEKELGCLVPRKESLFAKAIEESLGKTPDMKKRWSLYNAVSSKWSWDNSVDNLEKILRSVV